MRLQLTNTQKQEVSCSNGSGLVKQGIATIRVAILVHDELMREGLCALLGGTEDMICVGSWGSAEASLRGIEQSHPDVLLLDLRLPDSASIAMLKYLPSLSTATRILAMVECREERCVVLNPQSPGTQPKTMVRAVSQELAQPDDCMQIALKMGVHGAMRRQRPFAEIALAIRAVYSGQYYLEPSTAARLAQQHLLSLRHANSTGKSGSEMLTLRERQVLSLIAQGRSNKEIARELQLGYSTVKNYVSSILEKLSLSDRTQLALFAIQQINQDVET